MDYCLGCHPSALDGQLHRKHAKRLSCADCHGKKILIVTDSKHGSTAAYSDKLGAELCLKGFQVDIGRAHKMLTTDISGYDGYIIGSPTYWGFPLKDLRKFLEINSVKFAQKPTAYLYNSLEGAETGNVSAKAFLQFAYHPVLRNYPTIFPIAPYLQSQVPPNGTCDLSFNPASGMPRYNNCEVPAWVGLMPGSWAPRKGYPVEYMPMEIFGFGGYKPYYREEAATEYAQTLVDIKFFDGACTPNNSAPQVTASAAPTSGNQPLQVTFTATATDSDGVIQSYLWNFGDGTTSNLQNPTHVYSCGGTFTAKVKVTDNNCGIAVKSLTITVASTSSALTFDCTVAPIMKKYCNECHGSAGGLSTKTCDGLKAGGSSGPAVVPGNKEASLLYQTMTGGSPAMPPAGTTVVPVAEIAAVGAWIDSLGTPDCQVDFCSAACGH
jgi:PKD repeat protein